MMLRLRQHTYDAGIRRQCKWCQQLCAALAACSITCCGRLMPTAVGLTQWLQAAKTCTTHTLPCIHTLLAHHTHCHAIEAFQSWQAPGQLPAPHQLVAPIKYLNPPLITGWYQCFTRSQLWQLFRVVHPPHQLQLAEQRVQPLWGHAYAMQHRYPPHHQDAVRCCANTPSNTSNFKTQTDSWPLGDYVSVTIPD